MSPPRSLSELEDVSDTTSSLGSGDWTDLSSAHPDDVSDNASADGSEQPRPVSVAGNINDGSEEAWTTAEALSSSSASLYASVHAPLNPFESDGESERSDKSIRPAPYGTFGPLDPFHSDSGSERSEPHQELQLILPDPLERSGSTVAADVLSFSDDAVLATNPTAVVSLAGAHPSIAQRTVVVTDVLAAIARATHSSLVRADYYNFTSLSDLPTRVPNHNTPAKEISVLVRDHTDEPLTNSLDSTPSILVVFTSDAQESTVPSIHKHSILIPVVLSESRPVVLFDERDDRLPDESSVDIEELVRQLSNLFTFERDSVATTQTAVENVNQPEHDDKPSDSDVRTLDLDLGVHSLDAFDSDTKSVQHPAPEDTLVPDSGADVDEKPHKPVVRKRQPLDRIVGSERADAFRKFHANMGPGLTAACALAVVLSLVLGTNRLIQPSKAPFPNKTPGSINILPVSSHGVNTIPIDQPPVTGTSLTSNLPHSSLAVKSPHTSLALKSPHTALATKSPHTSLAVKSQHTSVAVRSSTTSSLVVKSQHTHLSVHAPVNVSCSTVPVSVSTSTSLSTTVVSTSLSTTAPSPSPASSSTDAKTRILNEVAEELGNAIERIERAIGLNLRRNTDAALKVLESVRKSSAVCKASDKADAVLDAVNCANEAIKAASGIDTAETLKTARGELHGRHQVARRTAQRQLASLKRGVESLVWGEDAVKEYVKGKGKEKGEESVNESEKKTPKGKGKAKEKLRPGREKWHTSKDHRGFRSERIAKKDKPKEGSEKKAKGCVKCGEKSKGKVPFPSREEQEKAQTAGRGKRPTSKDKSRHQEEEWTWTWEGGYEYEYPFGYGPRAVVEEVVEEVRDLFSF